MNEANNPPDGFADEHGTDTNGFLRNYDLNHEPIGPFDAAMLLSHPDRQVAIDTIGDVDISTVFLVTDHNHGSSPVPLLYETMVFADGGEVTWCERYATRDAALAGHDRACAWVRSPEQAPAPLQQALGYQG